MINKFNHGYKYFHIGPPKDYDLLEDIQIEKVETLDNADFVLFATMSFCCHIFSLSLQLGYND
mgnify:CR=1 FL=1